MSKIKTKKVKSKAELAKQKKQVKEYNNKCKGCGFPIHKSENFCGECMCEDDCGY